MSLGSLHPEILQILGLGRVNCQGLGLPPAIVRTREQNLEVYVRNQDIARHRKLGMVRLWA